MALTSPVAETGSQGTAAATPRPARRNRHRWRRSGLAAAATIASVILLFPVYWLVVTSLQPMTSLLTRDLTLVPHLNQLDGSIYTSTFQQYPLLRWLFNSTLVTLGTVAISLIVAVPAGYSFSRLRSGVVATGSGLFFLISRAVPGTFLAIPFFVMALRSHLIDSLWGVMIANSALIVPFAAWVLKGFFDAVPREIEEAGVVDGCGLFGTLVRIILPLAKPGIGAAAIYAAISAWSDYLFSATLLINPAHWTITVGAVSMVTEQKIDWNGLMATGVVSCIPMLIVFALLEPWLVSGLSAGSVVG